MSIFIPSISNSFNKQLIKFIIKNDVKISSEYFKTIKIKTQSFFFFVKNKKENKMQKNVPTRFKGAWSSFKWDNEKTRTISINTNASTSIKQAKLTYRSIYDIIYLNN